MFKIKLYMKYFILVEVKSFINVLFSIRKMKKLTKICPVKFHIFDCKHFYQVWLHKFAINKCKENKMTTRTRQTLFTVHLGWCLALLLLCFEIALAIPVDPYDATEAKLVLLHGDARARCLDGSPRFALPPPL